MRAGKRLGYTQSAISNQIAAFERLVGARLVERARGGSSISLTESGRLLYDHAVVLIARLQAARTDVAASWPELVAVLRVGYFQSIGATMLPRIVQRSRRARRGRASSWSSGTPTGSCRRSSPPARSTRRSCPRRCARARSRRRTCSTTRLSCWRHRGRSCRSSPTSPPGRCSPTSRVPPSASTSSSSTGATRRGTSCASRTRSRSRRSSPRATRTGSCRRSRSRRPSLTVEALDGPWREIHLVWQRDRSATDALRQFLDAAAGDVHSNGAGSVRVFPARIGRGNPQALSSLR